ncbi:MAG: STAS/SEC14 domain-containing protein [Lentisphaerae bacterium]|nr:STAS/SEC14 domain-containing protein [Lentisphaerota bacterium]
MSWLKKLFGQAEQAPVLSATLRKEPGNLHVLRVSGVLNKATMDNIQAVAARDIEAGAGDLRLLLMLDKFLGWKRGDNWGDIEFFARYGDQIAKIAVVGDARWEAETLAFLAAGRRKGEVKCFTPDQEAAARAWVKA